MLVQCFLFNCLFLLCCLFVIFCLCLSDKASEGTPWNDDGVGSVGGGDGPKTGDGFSDGDLQRHRSHIQDTTFDLRGKGR